MDVWHPKPQGCHSSAQSSRAPSRFSARSRFASDEVSQDQAWQDLVRRRQASKDKLARIKREVDQAISCLERRTPKTLPGSKSSLECGLKNARCGPAEPPSWKPAVSARRKYHYGRSCVIPEEFVHPLALPHRNSALPGRARVAHEASRCLQVAASVQILIMDPDHHLQGPPCTHIATLNAYASPSTFLLDVSDPQLASSSRQEADVSSIPMTTFKIPNDLMTRWSKLFRTDEDDESSESEYEYEEDDPDSPYSDIPILDISPDQRSERKLLEWVDLITDKSPKVFEVTNHHLVSSDIKFSIQEETIKNAKTNEVSALAEVTYCEMEKHGFYREWDCNGQHLLSCGRYLADKKKGVFWRRLDGNAFLVGRWQTPPGDTEMVYLYPDLTCAIIGMFNQDHHLISGRFGKVIGLDYDQGGVIPLPKVKILNEDDVFTYDPSRIVCISNTPLVRDPYEHEMVYVAKSEIPFAGEGLFAKRDIKAGTLLSLFNGVRQRETVINKKIDCFSDYRIALVGSGNSVSLDIPAQCASLRRYCATTGHKACHSFKPNSSFRELYHPRFGKIMSIFSEINLHKDQEILVCYNYRIHQAPEWYRDMYFEHLRQDQQLEESHLYLIAKRISFEHGVNVRVPVPAKTSPRFLPCGTCGSHVGYDIISLSCHRCSQWYHLHCTQLNQADIVDEDEQGHKTVKSIEWICPNCSEN